MWHDWEEGRDLHWRDGDESLPAGVIKVDVEAGTMVFGSSTVRLWGLKKYQKASLKYSDEQGMGAIHFLKAPDGDKAAANTDGGALTIRCKKFLVRMNAESCLYRTRKAVRGFVIVDFARARAADFH